MAANGDKRGSGFSVPASLSPENVLLTKLAGQLDIRPPVWSSVVSTMLRGGRRSRGIGEVDVRGAPPSGCAK